MVTNSVILGLFVRGHMKPVFMAPNDMEDCSSGNNLFQYKDRI